MWCGRCVKLGKDCVRPRRPASSRGKTSSASEHATRRAAVAARDRHDEEEEEQEEDDSDEGDMEQDEDEEEVGPDRRLR